VTAYQYDSANRISQITYPSGRIVTYTRDTLGQITQVQTQESATATAVTLVSNVAYKPFGPIRALTFGNGVATTIQYDADYRTSRITTTSTPAWDFIYTYDAAGNITQIADQVGSYGKSFGYDALDRVTTDNNPLGQWTYSYDAGGNRLGFDWQVSGSTVQQLTQQYATTSNRARCRW
jgi:YD repeat-containing protein